MKFERCLSKWVSFKLWRTQNGSQNMIPEPMNGKLNGKGLFPGILKVADLK
jgi:hypothetical protein